MAVELDGGVSLLVLSQAPFGLERLPVLCSSWRHLLDLPFYPHYFILCVWVCLHIYLCTMPVPDTIEGQKRASDLLGLELKMAVPCMWVLGLEL